MEEANINRPSNCTFILENISTVDPGKLEACDGIWMSYTLAYMGDPNYFISSWLKCLNFNGWFAIVDIDGLFSSHLPKNSKFANEIDLFEQNSVLNKIYDFRIGRKIKNIMEENGLNIIVAEDDWYDKELNFRGKASQDIVATWTKRFERMVRLKAQLGEKYTEFNKEFLAAISQKEHHSVGGVRFYVGVKRQ